MVPWHGMWLLLRIVTHEGIHGYIPELEKKTQVEDGVRATSLLFKFRLQAVRNTQASSYAVGDSEESSRPKATANLAKNLSIASSNTLNLHSCVPFCQQGPSLHRLLML